jgi:hypothetical protein
MLAVDFVGGEQSGVIVIRRTHPLRETKAQRVGHPKRRLRRGVPPGAHASRV